MLFFFIILHTARRVLRHRKEPGVGVPIRNVSHQQSSGAPLCGLFANVCVCVWGCLVA